MFLNPLLNRGEAYVTVPDSSVKYESCCFLFVPTLPVFAHRSGIYNAGENDRDCLIAIARTENLVVLLASFFCICKYVHADRLFVYTQLDFHHGFF